MALLQLRKSLGNFVFLLRDKDILFLGERETLRNYLGLYCNIGKESRKDLGRHLGFRKQLRKGLELGKFSLGRGLGN